MRASSDDWEARERGLAFAQKEAVRLFQRARPKLRWLVVLGLVFAAAYPVRRARQKRVYDAEVALRLVETDKDLTREVKPPTQYFAYIWGVFLSGPNLKKIIERYQLYPDKWARDPQIAVEAMRDDLDVKVWRNYFVEEYYSDDDEARSARVSIVWHYKDPEIALEVVRALGALIMESETESRRQVFAAAQKDVDEAAEQELEHLVAVRRALDVALAQLDRGTPQQRASAQVKVQALTAEEKELGKRVEQIANTRTRFELTAAWEQQRSGIRFELIEPGVVRPQPLPGPISVALTTVTIFLLTIFLGGVVVGAFESRVRQPADVFRLGVPVLGAVPSFKGDSVGNLAERLRAEDRIRLEKR